MEQLGVRNYAENTALGIDVKIAHITLGEHTAKLTGLSAFPFMNTAENYSHNVTAVHKNDLAAVAVANAVAKAPEAAGLRVNEGQSA